MTYCLADFYSPSIRCVPCVSFTNSIFPSLNNTHSYNSCIKFKIQKKKKKKGKKKYTSAIGAGVSKSDSPAAKRITGTPASTRAMAWSILATVLEGLMELTFGLREISTSIAFTSNFVVLCGGFITFLVENFKHLFKTKRQRQKKN